MIDYATALLLAKACAAAYCDQDDAQRKKLLDAAGLIEDRYLHCAHDAHALVCHTGNAVPGLFQRIVAFAGTEFSEGELPSIRENLLASPVNVGGGYEVASGYWDQVQSLSPELGDLPDQPNNGAITAFTGHSMGGCIAELYANTHWKGRVIPVVSFGAPKCANLAFWRDARLQPTRFVHARDFAPIWPLLPNEWEQPGEQWWLHEGQCEPNLHRPVMPDSIADHAITAYISALESVQ